MRQKVGIIGGTFNPIHLGHISLAKTAYEQLSLDKVIFMPSGKSYMKRNLYVLPGEIRLTLINMSIRDYPYFESSDMEITRNGNTYTYETLELLKSGEPETDFYFIMGADCLYTIEKWVYPDRIFQAASIVAAVRDSVAMDDLAKQATYLEHKFHANITLLKFPPMDISSSMIRERISSQTSIRGLVPAAAEEYILANKLFLSEGESN